MKIFYCRPWTCTLVVHDVAAEHEAELLRRRLDGALSPRHLWAAQPNVFRESTPEEWHALATQHGCPGFYVHEWIVTNNAVTEVIE